MKRAMIAAGAVLALSAGAASAQVPPMPSEPDCMIHLSDVRHPLRFRDFPARPWRAAHYPRPILDTPVKRAYRTRIRLDAAEGPNFAGHFRIALWGAGTGGIDVTFIDEQTGEVVFEPSLQLVWGGHVGDEPSGRDDYRVRFRPDSRLVIVLGLPNEDEDDAKEGVYFYEWTGRRLKLLRFVPQARACHPDPQ